jgi:hypothetical protein
MVDFWQSCRLVVNPLGSIWSVGVSDSRRRDRCDGRYEQDGRGWRRHKSGPRTRCNATVSERLPPIVRIVDVTHPLYGQQLEVSASGPSRRIGWVGVLLRDGRHRWIPQKATDLEEAACGVRPNRDLPRVSVRTLLPLAQYVRARLSAAGAGVDETSGLTANPAVRTGIVGSAADLGPEIVADDDAESAATVGEAGSASAPVRADRG